MKITLILIGKTTAQYLNEGVNLYEKRIKKYLNFDITIIPELKNTKKLSVKEQKEKEGKLLLDKISKSDTLILSDEKGKEFSSVKFAGFIENKMISATKSLVFVIGGPYGFSENVYKRANNKISLSKMTFSHQLVRVLFIEQLYRAFTIINGEPYHHE